MWETREAGVDHAAVAAEGCGTLAQNFGVRAIGSGSYEPTAAGCTTLEPEAYSEGDPISIGRPGRVEGACGAQGDWACINEARFHVVVD